MDLNKLEQDISTLVDLHSDNSQNEFIYKLLLAYDFPKSSITRLKKGDYNQSKNKAAANQEILWKKKVFFKIEKQDDLLLTIDSAQHDKAILKHNPRFIIVTDFKTLLAVDTKVGDSLDIPFAELSEHYTFFLPWAGMEKTQIQSLNLADVKAAEKLAQLYDIIIQENQIETESERHGLNIFLSRLLFCFFAEDTGIFDNDQFTNAIASHTQDDGSDLQDYLIALFKVMNIEKRTTEPQHVKDFPYVNGGLFAVDYPAPKLNAKARKMIIDAGTLNWKQINPDIFGSMMQAVVHSDQRGSLGMHYTSVANIMKVIEPLFLSDLRIHLRDIIASEKGVENKLTKLLDRLYHLHLFDPACGSGNFLIIAYKELCKCEIEIFSQLQQVNPTKWAMATGMAKSGIQLTQFYGIELDDFAHETAKLSLWLAEHQMNLEFKSVFGSAKPILPLQDGGHIVCGNATRLDWEEVCPKEDGAEIYIMGNPPYLGAKVQSTSQKFDVKTVLEYDRRYKSYDYIFCWFEKASRYIQSSTHKFSFVSTNSVCQGEQVIFWQNIKDKNLEIDFAHTSFKWQNNAKSNAGVICVIIGIRNIQNKTKTLFNDGAFKLTKKINFYLLESSDVIIKRKSVSVSHLPPMLFGSIPYDGGNLILTDAEKKELISNFPESRKYIRLAIGASELIRGTDRWCLWISEDELNEALEIPPIRDRIEKVKQFRLASKTVSTQKAADFSYRFKQYTYKHSNVDLIIIPRVSSERREYLPIKFFPKDTITVDAQVIYNAPIYLFGVISSTIHMSWMKLTSGRMKSDIRYSSAVTYNTFPFPEISKAQKTTLEDHVFNVLDEREKHPEKTMAELYDPDKMPEGLRQAHHEMDSAVEQCYRKQAFKSDEERLEYLFKLYEEMIEKEKRVNK